MEALRDASQPQDTSPIAIRTGLDSDWPLLRATFANHYIKNPQSYYGYRVPPHTLVTKLEQFKTSPAWRLLVACPVGIPDEIMGMLLYRTETPRRQNPAVAWLTTKPLYQRAGVATALLKHAKLPKGEIDCAFLLPHIAKLASPKGYTLRFRPYLPDVELWNELNKEETK